jgi:hypothetical protein
MKLFIISVDLTPNLITTNLKNKIFNILLDNSVDEVVFFYSLCQELQNFIYFLCDGNRFDYYISTINTTVFDNFITRREIKNCDILFIIRSEVLNYSIEWESIAKEFKTVYYIYDIDFHNCF